MAVNQWTLEPGVKSAHPTRTRMSFASAPPPPSLPSQFCPALCCCCCCQAESYAIFTYYFHNQYSIWAKHLAAIRAVKRASKDTLAQWCVSSRKWWPAQWDGNLCKNKAANFSSFSHLGIIHFKPWHSVIDLQPLCRANFPCGNTDECSWQRSIRLIIKHGKRGKCGKRETKQQQQQLLLFQSVRRGGEEGEMGNRKCSKQSREKG